ncbi:MAG: cupredoxin domain-containing protein [Sphingomonadales bacterium]
MRLSLVIALVAATAPAAAAVAGAHAYTIVIDKLKFGPVPSGLKAGDTIVWVNKDIFRHSVTARDGSFDIDLQPKASGRLFVRRPGIVPFLCKFHPGMTGTLRISR